MNTVTDFFDDDSVETVIDPNELYAVPEDEQLPDESWIQGGAVADPDVDVEGDDSE